MLLPAAVPPPARPRARSHATVAVSGPGPPGRLSRSAWRGRQRTARHGQPPGTRSPKVARWPARSWARPPFRTASYSVFQSVYLPTPETLEAGNAQAVPGI